MNATPTYAQNDILFADFYQLQRCLAGHLAAEPALIRAWLEALPPREPEAGRPSRAARSWRTARLSVARRRELDGLLLQAESSAAASPLAAWLLAAVPVRTYFEMAGAGGPGGAPPAGARDCHRRLLELRETLFLGNYGLAKAAARRRGLQDYGDMLAAASDGLLDAIDRYVPGPQSARFAYFAGYWIRYHMARHFQKSGSVVSFPVNQHRIGRRIDRYLAARQPGARAPSAHELCQELRLGHAAYFWQQQRPRVVSLHGPEGAAGEAPAMELVLCDPAPEPAAEIERAEIAERLRLLVAAHAAPDARLMLAYAHGVGVLADAAEDYLAALLDLARARLAGAASEGVKAICSSGGRGPGT
jgi:DNA-directed RNA polymerase specialized sigma subunit